MSAGGSVASSDSRFERKGKVETSSWRDLTDGQKNRFDKAFSMVNDSGATERVGPMATGFMNREWGDVPYNGALCQVVKSNLPSNGLYGEKSLQAQAGVNPFSSQFADNTFNRYSDEVHRMLGQVRSGPMAARGGTAANGYMQSDAINQLALNREDVLNRQQQSAAGIQQNASQLLAQQRQGMNQAALAGIGSGFDAYGNLQQSRLEAGQLASSRAKMFGDLVPAWAGLASKMHGTEKNNLVGRGAQTSSSLGAGVNVCCFIFLEAYNGVLPESVRKYRDMAAPENSKRRNGYINMSKWLVPAMRVNGFSRWMVNHLLVKPLTKYGEWFYGNNRTGWIFWPVKQAWFALWTLTGK